MISQDDYIMKRIDVPEREKRPICPFYDKYAIICNNSYTARCLDCEESEKKYHDFLTYARERGFKC